MAENPPEEQKAEFYRLLEAHISSLGEKKKDNYCISQERYNKALQALQLTKWSKCPEGGKFKFWATKNFDLQEIGSKKILYCKKSSRPVVPKEDIFDTIKCQQAKEDPAIRSLQDRFSKFRLSYHPHRLEMFSKQLTEAFDGNCKHTVYGDFKPIDQVKDPGYYIHVVQKL